MYLKSLTLKGFKSFADRQVLTMEPGITAIVGPNGSGKSNISDAVLWVLGELNAKHLRGQAMEDVIFAGSSARKATSVAEAQLVLDNSDHTLPVDFDEVVIARRMYRTGESEYLINGVQVRRMDVLDILHDTGLGAGTHSIISQGSIDSVLQSKPEDRRALIEEAAGVLKHKQRMARSERKLDRMQNHVTRVADVVAEVERQLGPLERKAKRAKRYEELAGELADARLVIAVDDLRRLQRQHEEVKANEAQLEEGIAAKKASIDEVDAQIEELQRKIRTESEDAGELSKQQRAASSALERMESAMALMRERRRGALSRASEIEVAMQVAKADAENAEAALTKARSEFSEALQANEAAELRANQLQEQLSEVTARRDALEAEADGVTGKVFELESESEKLREQLVLTQESLTSGLAHIKVLDGHTAELELAVERTSADARSAEAEAKVLEEALSETEAREREARMLVASCTHAREASRNALDEARAQEQSIKAQIEALDALEQKRAEAEGDARQWVESNRQSLSVDPRPLSHAVKAEKGLEGIVELLLGRDMSALVLANGADVKRVVRGLSSGAVKGELTMIVADGGSSVPSKVDVARGAASSDGRRLLLDALSYSPEFSAAIESLLGDVVVCSSIDDALEAHASDTLGLRFVVPGGAMVWPSGKVSVGLSVLEEEQGVLARIRHLDELRKSLVSAVEVTKKAQRDAEAAESSLRDAQQDSLKLSESLAELRGSVQSARAIASQALQKLAASNKELEEATRQRKQAEASVAEAKPGVEKLASRMQEVKEQIEQLKASQVDISEKLVPVRGESERLSAELTEAKLAFAKSQEKKNYNELMVTRHVSDLERMALESDSNQKLIRAKEVSARRIEGLIGIFEALVLSATSRARQLEEAADVAQSSTSGLHAQSEQLRQKSHQAHNAYDAVAEQLSNARVDKARIEMQVEQAVQEIVEGCKTPLEIALKTPAPPSRADAEDELFRLNRRIANLGTINPDAAKEYDELKERYDYLAGQLADLSGAAASLRKIDRIIEARMKDDFVNTFDEINKNFQDVFELLFPGGRAHLSLENPEDLENTGVEVHAQPAGKRIAKMSLMSGGEKSLTALALLFALYRTRPTPFYILDEVEAALDDTNLRRLVSFINAMRDDTQLIMITHQRRTMEMADVLFGVSMQADGVTKVVSQKLENALRNAE